MEAYDNELMREKQLVTTIEGKQVLGVASLVLEKFGSPQSANLEITVK